MLVATLVVAGSTTAVMPILNRTAEAADCHESAPPTLTSYLTDDREMTRLICNTDVALYGDAALAALPAAQTAWIEPFTTAVWVYLRDRYGDCSVPRTLPAQLGPCADFGAPRPLFGLYHGTGAGGTEAPRLIVNGGRNTISVSYTDWSATSTTARDIIAHEACHVVENGSQGLWDSPAYDVWGDSRWAEFCMYDLYQNTGRTADAQRLFHAYSEGANDNPAGAVGAHWFHDWFYPLWREHGSEVMNRYFGLLSRHFPKININDGTSQGYARRMTTGEFVHFMSGAAGVDLSGRAATAFNTGFDRAEFAAAKEQFPEITYANAPCLVDGAACPTPSVAYPGPQSFSRTTRSSVRIAATAPGGGALTYRAEGLPTGLSIDAASGEISGVATATTAATGTATVTAAAGADTASTTFLWTVADRTGPVRDGTGQCADNWDGRADDGNHIQSQNCTGIRQQHAAITGETWTYGGKCVSLDDDRVTDGTTVVLWTCDGRTTQRWQIDDATGTIRNGASNTCLTGHGFQQDLTISRCDGSADQQWLAPGQSATVTHPGEQSTGRGSPVSTQITAVPATPGQALTYSAAGLPAGLTMNTVTGRITGTVTAPAGRYTVTISARSGSGTPAGVTFNWTINDFTGAIADGDGFCIDNWDGRTDDGNRIMSQNCTGIAQQRISITGGTWSFGAKCMSLEDSEPHDGTKVSLWTCDGSTRQQWRTDAATGTVRNVASGTCLTGNDFQADLTVTACVPGAARQTWRRIPA
ncbi:ricin-type beta-trefoil lectin domain protein [Catenuloplanes atrovinosus]|uniref:Ricin B lectin domain-containing protein n=1 Tax=Catenuloplanes atrovinosus TaxID=137266 RepID=A0AAE3YP17_9ACTN|nr:ricin-type beta-trefoil lectin domain protein [Catenuloplanes atrovinosus]MDR7277324.1 hypothetical protein [Catenuloplanes atrovinosus]